MVQFLKELHTALPFGPATSLLGAYPKGLKGGIQRGIGAPTFPAASFAVGGMWEQPKCPSTGELMNKTRSIHVTGRGSALRLLKVNRLYLCWSVPCHEKEGNPDTFVYDMDEPRGHYTK